jgi:hypothetical protein
MPVSESKSLMHPKQPSQPPPAPIQSLQIWLDRPLPPHWLQPPLCLQMALQSIMYLTSPPQPLLAPVDHQPPMNEPSGQPWFPVKVDSRTPKTHPYNCRRTSRCRSCPCKCWHLYRSHSPDTFRRSRRDNRNPRSNGLGWDNQPPEPAPWPSRMGLELKLPLQLPFESGTIAVTLIAPRGSLLLLRHSVVDSRLFTLRGNLIVRWSCQVPRGSPPPEAADQALRIRAGTDCTQAGPEAPTIPA